VSANFQIMNINFDPLTGSALPVYLRYAIPSTFGLLVFSSTQVVDAYFVGNYIGANALAAINLAAPFVAIIWGISLMITIGSNVLIGDAIGSKDWHHANQFYCQSLVTNAVFGIVFALIAILFIDDIVPLLGQSDILSPILKEYLQYYILLTPLMVLGAAMYYLMIIEERPVVAFIAILLSSLLNVYFDWLFITVWSIGIKGAALATGLSLFFLFLILIIFQIALPNRLHLQWIKPNWVKLKQSLFNGFSEMVNEWSVGITILLFNWIILIRIGEIGVAAYSIVEYIFYLFAMCYYGIAESLPPLISKNVAAGYFHRVKKFFNLTIFGISFFSLLAIALIYLIPDRLVTIFMSSSNTNLIELTKTYLFWFAPTLAFIGFNIAISAYFTGLQKPIQSSIIAMLRCFVFPIVLILTLPNYIGDIGIFVAVAIAELLTLVISIGLWLHYCK